MSTRFPDFFVIGAPKCGTTSMFSWLQLHPDTYLPVKEPGFLSLDLLDVRNHPEGIQTEAEYLTRLCPPKAKGKLTGESTPKYLYSDDALAWLSPHAGQIKLIVMLRNPVDLAIAMHAQNLRQGREREPDFGRAWKRGPVHPGDKLTDYSFWGQPGIRLERWLATFPRADIRIVILEEDMGDCAHQTHADTLVFLGLPPHVLVSYAAENPRRSYRSRRLQGASRRARRAAYDVLYRLGVKPRGTGVLRLFDKLNGNWPNKPEIIPALRAEVAQALAEDAQRIARLLERDRMPWPDFNWDGLVTRAKAHGA